MADVHTKNQISYIASLILDKSIDPIIGIRELHHLMSLDISIEEDDYLIIAGLEDGAEEFIKGEIRKNFSDSLLKERDELEQEYLKDNKNLINKIMYKLSVIDNI